MEARKQLRAPMGRSGGKGDSSGRGGWEETAGSGQLLFHTDHQPASVRAGE